MSQNKGKKDGGEVNRGERGSSTVDNKAPKVAQQNNSIDILLRNIKLPEKTTKVTFSKPKVFKQKRRKSNSNWGTLKNP